MRNFPQFPQLPQFSQSTSDSATRRSQFSRWHSLHRATWITSWTTVFSLLLSPMVAPVAIADYQQVTPSRPQSPSFGLGTRGGCSGQSTSAEPEANVFKIVTPQHDTTTQTTHPTVTWFVPDAEPIASEIHLYRYLTQPSDISQRELVKNEPLQSQTGLNEWTLPISVDALTPGQYQWQVVLLCDPSYPSSAIAATVNFSVKP